MEILFALICLVALVRFAATRRQRPSMQHASVDAVVPAYNEEVCLEQSLGNLLRNRYIQHVICINDGSTDGTASVLENMKGKWGDRLIVVNQENTGKGGALMHGLKYATARQVFLTDADTYVPHESDGLGYMLGEIEKGADAVGGIPSSNLSGAGLLPFIRASVKLPMIAFKRTFQQVLGGSPFIISGACGMFRTDVLRKHGFSDRTKVEDLDMTWTLIANGYKVRQSIHCVVYPQECNTIRDEWRRWRRWIVGYAVCMRLHSKLLPTRFGLFSILPMFALVVMGVFAYVAILTESAIDLGPLGVLTVLFPVLWVAVVTVLGGISAVHHRKVLLAPLASLAVFYVVFAYSIWMIHGLKGLITGREPVRDKPTRYSNVVE